MASKANITFHVLLLSLALIVANFVRLKVLPVDVESQQYLGYYEDSYLNFTQMSAKYGFNSEEHTVVTEDGYVLTIFRIRSRECDQIKRTPIILMHGLLQSSDGWLDVGPNAGLAYLIAGACYDLWLGNQRGNYYSRRHIQLDPDRDAQFWQFSVDEIGLYDIPATIDYILSNTGVEKLSYIGYSQGGGIFFIMCSERPGYCDKVNILIALAPATRHLNTKSVLFRAAAETARISEGFLSSLGIHEIFSKGGTWQKLLINLCKFRVICKVTFGTVLGLIDTFHPGSITSETMQVMNGHSPAGTSTHNMARYGQSMRTENFQKFDYGKVKNVEMYGTEQPPVYNLTAVTVPAVVLYGRDDNLVDLKDILWLLNKLPNVLEAQEIADPLWNHFDIAYSRHIKTVIFPKVNEYLLKCSPN